LYKASEGSEGSEGSGSSLALKREDNF